MTEKKPRRVGPLFAIRIAEWLRALKDPYPRTRTEWEDDLCTSTGMVAAFVSIAKIAEEVKVTLPIVREGAHSAESAMPEMIRCLASYIKAGDCVSPVDTRTLRALARAIRSIEDPNADFAVLYADINAMLGEGTDAVNELEKRDDPANCDGADPGASDTGTAAKVGCRRCAVRNAGVVARPAGGGDRLGT